MPQTSLGELFTSVIQTIPTSDDVDKKYEKPVGGIPASDIAAGVIPSTTDLAPKASPVFTGSISLGRKASTTVGSNSFAVGDDVQATAINAHAEGSNTEATNADSHAEGYYSKATGKNTHAQGTYNSNMTNFPSWAENTQYQVNDLVNRYGLCYICIEANADETFTSSKWKSVQWSTKEAFVVGNGTANNNRSNALTLNWSGDLHLLGDIYTGANADGTGGTKLTSCTEMTVAESNTMFDEVFGDYIYTQSSTDMTSSELNDMLTDIFGGD